MNRLYERMAMSVALAPVSQAAAGNSTTAYVDASTLRSLDFVVAHGALAAGKKLTVEVLNADNNQGTGAKTIATAEYTAPTGGWTDGMIVVSVDAAGTRDRYYAVKITNDAASAVLLSVTVNSTGIYREKENHSVLKV